VWKTEDKHVHDTVQKNRKANNRSIRNEHE
jgi:hypothetical protein